VLAKRRLHLLAEHVDLPTELAEDGHERTDSRAVGQRDQWLRSQLLGAQGCADGLRFAGEVALPPCGPQRLLDLVDGQRLALVRCRCQRQHRERITTRQVA
jgi:hypothetical protein